MRYYSNNGIKKWINFFEKNKNKCKTFKDMIEKIEIQSTYITDNKTCFFKINKNFKKNVHFENEYTKKYLEKFNYPLVKIKRITIFGKNNLPSFLKSRVKDFL